MGPPDPPDGYQLATVKDPGGLLVRLLAGGVFIVLLRLLIVSETTRVHPRLLLLLLGGAFGVGLIHLLIQAAVLHLLHYRPRLFLASLSVIPLEQFVDRRSGFLAYSAPFILTALLLSLYFGPFSPTIRSVLGFWLAFQIAVFVMDLYSLFEIQSTPSQALIYPDYDDDDRLVNYVFEPVN